MLLLHQKDTNTHIPNPPLFGGKRALQPMHRILCVYLVDLRRSIHLVRGFAATALLSVGSRIRQVFQLTITVLSHFDLNLTPPQKLTFHQQSSTTMTSSGRGDSGGSEDKSTGLAKFMRRASLVLKRDKSKRQSVPSPSELAPVSDPVIPTQTSSTPTTR